MEHTILSYLTYILGPSRTAQGEIGVSIFFVLSGFLISTILLQARETHAPARNSLTKFYFRRVLRIFPAYYLLVIASVAFHWPYFTAAKLWNFFYLTNFYVAIQNHWHRLCWSPLGLSRRGAILSNLAICTSFPAKTVSFASNPLFHRGWSLRITVSWGSWLIRPSDLCVAL